MMAEAKQFLFEDEVYIADGERPQGRGIYSQVWVAHGQENQLRRSVKVVDKRDREVLEAEFATLQELMRLDNQGAIIRALALGQTDDGQPCLLLEMVAPRPLAVLAQELRARKTGGESQAWSADDEKLRARVATQVTNALYIAFSGGVGLKGLKLDSFYFDEYEEHGEQRFHVRIIDWNLVDAINPRKAFVTDTLPRLGAVLYEIFTGGSLEPEPGKIDRNMLGRLDAAQSWPMYWDQITYETQAILFDMLYSGIKEDNPALDLLSRWSEHLKFLEEGVPEKLRSDMLESKTADDILQKGHELTRVMTACDMLQQEDSTSVSQLDSLRRSCTHTHFSDLKKRREYSRLSIELLTPDRRWPGDIIFAFYRLVALLNESVPGAENQILSHPLIESFAHLWDLREYPRIHEMLGDLENFLSRPDESYNAEAARLINLLQEVLDFYAGVVQIEFAFQDGEWRKAAKLHKEMIRSLAGLAENVAYLHREYSGRPSIWKTWEHIPVALRSYKLLDAKSVRFEEALLQLEKIHQDDTWHEPRTASIFQSLRTAVQDLVARKIGDLEQRLSLSSPEKYAQELGEQAYFVAVSLDELESRSAQIDDQSQKLKHHINDQLSKTLDGLQNGLRGIEEMQSQSVAKVEALNTANDALSPEVEESAANVKILNGKISEIEKETLSLRPRFADMANELAPIYQEIKQIESSIIDGEQTVGEVRRKIANLRAVLDGTQAELASDKEEIIHLQERFGDIKAHTDQIIENREALFREYSEASHAFSEDKAALESLQKQIHAAQSDLVSFLSDRDTLDNQIKEITNAIQISKTRFKLLPEQLDALQSELQVLPAQGEQIGAEFKILPEQLDALQSELEAMPAQREQIAEQIEAETDAVQLVEKQIEESQHRLDKLAKKRISLLESLAQEKEAIEALKLEQAEAEESLGISLSILNRLSGFFRRSAGKIRKALPLPIRLLLILGTVIVLIILIWNYVPGMFTTRRPETSPEETITVAPSDTAFPTVTHENPSILVVASSPTRPTSTKKASLTPARIDTFTATPVETITLTDTLGPLQAVVETVVITGLTKTGNSVTLNLAPYNPNPAITRENEPIIVANRSIVTATAIFEDPRWALVASEGGNGWLEVFNVAWTGDIRELPLFDGEMPQVVVVGRVWAGVDVMLVDTPGSDTYVNIGSADSPVILKALDGAWVKAVTQSPDENWVLLSLEEGTGWIERRRVNWASDITTLPVGEDLP